MAQDNGGGFVFEGSPWMSSLYPEFETARQRLAQVVWTRKGSLPLKIREIIAVAVLAYRAYPTIETHMRRAMAAGATFRELVEALQTASVPGGHPCLHFAMPHLKKIHEELGERADELGNVIPTVTERESGTEWPWMRENYPEYEDIRDQLKDQVWAPANPALAVKYRETVAAVVLAHRAYPTVARHLRRAIREGATVAELVEAMQTAALLGGMPILHFTLPDLIAIQRELEEGTFA